MKVFRSVEEILAARGEHLGTSDSMVIRVRRALIRAATALRDQGVVPPGVDQPHVYAQRSGGVILPRNVDWFEATKDLRKAFVQHPPETVQASLGRVHTNA
jgi:phthalate 4,5-dioxygenase